MEKKRILHVVGGMDRGGVETWLITILRHLDRRFFQMDFLVHTEKECFYDAEIKSLGSRIIFCPYTSNPLAYAYYFKKILRSHGPYDVVHSHVHHFSGFILWLSHQSGIPMRIAHCHSDNISIQENAPILRRCYFALMKRLVLRYATVGLAGSRPAAAALFGPNWMSNQSVSIFPYGIDVDQFYGEVDGSALRTALGIPATAGVIGHVGRFVPVKNHRTLIEIIREVLKERPEVYLLLIGDGPLRIEIEEQANRAGIAKNLVFAGNRDDVPDLMTGVMDMFVLPSLYEGLPLVLLEAQSAGLPCIFTDTITKEVDINHRLVNRIALKQSPSHWAQAIITILNNRENIDKLEAFNLVRDSRYSIQTNIKKIEELYSKVNTPVKTN